MPVASSVSFPEPRYARYTHEAQAMELSLGDHVVRRLTRLHDLDAKKAPADTGALGDQVAEHRTGQSWRAPRPTGVPAAHTCLREASGGSCRAHRPVVDDRRAGVTDAPSCSPLSS